MHELAGGSISVPGQKALANYLTFLYAFIFVLSDLEAVLWIFNPAPRLGKALFRSGGSYARF